MKKLCVALVVVAVGFYAVKKTNLASYTGTAWSQVRGQVKKQVPTRFELERVRHEIAGLEGDIRNMIRPIAEYMADVSRLKKDIQSRKTSLAEQKTNLVTMARDLEGNPVSIVYGGEEYSAERVKLKLQRDFVSYQECEKQLQGQEKLLEAKEKSLASTREQLGKLMSKKRDYEVRLAHLEAEEETLRIASMGSKIPLDDSRATEIEMALTEIERRHDVQRAQIELASGALAGDAIPVGQKNRSRVGPQEVLNYFQGKGVVTASNK